MLASISRLHSDVKVLQRFVFKARKSADIVEFKISDFLEDYDNNFQEMRENWNKIRSESYPNAELNFVKESNHTVRLIFNKFNVYVEWLYSLHISIVFFSSSCYKSTFQVDSSQC